MSKFILLLSFFGSFVAMAQQPAPVQALTFQAWKDQQILDAQNQTLRVSARIAQLKSTKTTPAGKTETTAPVSNSKVKKAEVDPLTAAERDLRRAQESLSAAGGLTLQDYVSVYLPTLQEEPEALQNLALKLSKEELAEIFKMLVMSKGSTRDAQSRQGSLSEALGVSPTSKAL